MKQIKNIFGNTLKTLLSQKSLTAKDLSRDLNIPYRTVQEWLGAGGRIPREAETIKSLSNYFGISTHYLLFGEQDPREEFISLIDKAEVHTGLYEITIKKVKTKSGK
ncbi:helix-turn-helix domain-containing protein [Bdellovibrio bacteriovorus]|uniref:helix-turn-helix domain-containing protein n=1 Tax=Bdellovibrio bacteriovorus TaxID=959 RepID=UPI00059F6765|nr:helix-turn-helix transcriptional regulator [Bdellovibrio bacteriovorus]